MTLSIIYKSGYEALETGALRDRRILKNEDGKPVIMLKKLETIEERRRHSTPGWGDIPCDKAKLLIQEINKENKFLGLGKEGCVRR